MKSVSEQIKALIDYQFKFDDLTEWADIFITSIAQKTEQGNRTIDLSDKQVTKVEELYLRYIEGVINGRVPK
jgi:hypothetical protein